VTTYNWSGLLQRRVAIMIAVLTVLPGSCIAGQFEHGGFTWLAGFAGLLGGFTWIRAWKCPRCAERYAGTGAFPWVRPFRQDCLHCGLPGFTPTAEEAPPPIERAPWPIVTTEKQSLLMQQSSYQIRVASRSDRLLGQFIDGIIGSLPFFAAMGIMRLGNTLGALAFWAGIAWYVAYFFFADGLRDGQSLAKRYLGTRVVDADTGAPCTFGQSFVRNLFAVLGPIDLIFIFGERHQRLGDKAAGTIVVYD
jgi:uncharacterized RDD family membrane protein YckC